MAEDEKILKEQAEAETAEEMKQEDAQAAETESPETSEPAEETEAAAEAAEEDKEEEAPEAETVEGTVEGKPDKKDQQIREINDKYLRLFAEFDNFRKRSDLEKSGMYAEGQKNVLLKVLPLIDNFERALGTIPEDQKETPLAEGIEKVYRSFMDQLTELGVKPIEAAGQPFDANFHNAVMHIEDESLPENVVAEEFQKGYMFKDKVLRYSMVKVAN